MSKCSVENFLSKLLHKSTLEVAQMYILTYINFVRDPQQLRHFYTDESVFEDPTAALLAKIVPTYGKSIHVKGGDEIVKVLEEVIGGADKYTYEIHSRFASGQHASFTGLMTFEASGAAFGAPNAKGRFETTRTTTLRIENGKVLHHIDFVDWAEVIRQAMVQLGYELSIALDK